MSRLAGEQLGPYELVGPIGRGGMGEVWKARDTRLDRIVAIKFSQEHFNERFRREARTIAALNHPHICTLYDVGPDYLVMEYVDGKSPRGPLPLRTALQYATQIADALQAAHAKGIVHRDLKPDNVLVTKSGVKLLDFGLAKVSDQTRPGELAATVTEALTKENTILGTLQYMSPEQLEGKPADARSDTFAFGLVIYELITGKPAFEASSQASLIAAVLKEEPPPLARFQQSIPAAVDRLVRKCLAKDPDARWQSMVDLRDELKWISETSLEMPAVESQMSKGGRFGKAWKVPALLALALGIGLGAGMFWQSRRAPAASPPWVGTALGGPLTAHCPRVSPDGKWVAFLALVDNLAQVAIMRSDGSSWTVLTTQKDTGYGTEIAWAPDGSKLFFSRYAGRPRGVYSIPVLGGEPRLIRENANGGIPLPDGSLILAAMAGKADAQLLRFWPDSGREEALPAILPQFSGEFMPVALFPGGKEMAFFGVYSAEPNHSGAPGLYVLDLESKKAHPLGDSFVTWYNSAMPMAATPDGKSLITLASVEDVQQIVRVPRDGGPREVLFSVRTNEIWYLSVGPDGSIFRDSVKRPMTTLQFPSAGGRPEQSAQGWSGHIDSLPDGKLVFALRSAGKAHLVSGSSGAEPQAFLHTTEESDRPLGVSKGGTIALRLGTPPKVQIAIASARDGRIVRRLSIKGEEVQSMALSPDGLTLYYAASGSIWSLLVSESEPPRRILAGDEVLIDPAGRALYIKQTSKDPPALVRLPLEGGGAVEELAMPDGLRLVENPLPSSAVDSRGRVIFESSSANSFYYRPAIYDPARKSVSVIPVAFEGDIWSPVWTGDDRITAVGSPIASSIWRYHPVVAKER